MEYITEGAAEYVMTLFPEGFKGVCVDVGAYDPVWINNTWIFEKAGWAAYCIEPNAKCIAKLKTLRKNVLEYACGSKNADDVEFFIYAVPAIYKVGEAAGSGLIKHAGEWHDTILNRIEKVKVRTLDWLMENEIKEDHIDYLSIDVERNEMEVLRGTDLAKWGIKVICVENLEKEVEQYKFLEDRKYRYVHRIAFNDFYIRNDYYHTNFQK